MHVDTISPMYTLFFVLWIVVQAISPVPSVPDRVQALVKSCVVIPCSFTPPSPHPHRGRKERVNIRLRFRSHGHLFPLRGIAFTSEDRDQVSRDFQGRTALIGQITDGDCSMKIESITLDDARLFEIALKGGDDLLWGKPRSFNLDVIETPEAPVISGMLAATEGQLITVNCSVSYHCPFTPPILQWSWERGAHFNNSEAEEIQTLSPEPHRQMLLAPLTFTVTHQVKPRLKCEVIYPGVKSVANFKDLHVTFSPKEVKVQVLSLRVHEGGNALLVCSCKADPPVSKYHWSYIQRGHTVNIPQYTHTIRVYNVTRDMRVRCSAQNLIGRGESQLMPLNIQYKPVIIRLSSTCLVVETELLCHCSVDSNPKSVVTWSINGTVPPHDYNVSVTSEPHLQTAYLRGQMSRPMKVICFAVNALGNDSLVLLQGGEVPTHLWWLVIPAVAICSIIFSLSVVVSRCRKRAAKDAHLAVDPEGLEIYQDRMPLYINCTEVTHIYTNGNYQLVYQNCTPLFVHSNNIHPVARRGGERNRREESLCADTQAAVGVRFTREAQDPALVDAETAVYLEIL